MKSIMKNTKWMLLFYFLLTGLLMTAIFYIGSDSGYLVIKGTWVWIYSCLGFLLLSIIIGYMAGQRIQRRIDVLELNMLQVSKGNLSVRIGETDDPTFARLYHEFNNVMDSIERKWSCCSGWASRKSSKGKSRGIGCYRGAPADGPGSARYRQPAAVRHSYVGVVAAEGA